MEHAADLLAGRSFLIVEDQYLVARELSRFVRRLGGEVLGPVATSAAALVQISGRRPDCVLLDVDLDGERSDAIADALIAAGIPFVITTGYDRSAIDPRFSDVPLVGKPVSELELANVLSARVGHR